MSDDLAALEPDAPAVEPAPGTSVPASVTDRPGSRHRNLGRPSGLIACLLVAIAMVGLLASTPPSAGSDEPVQQATAWYLSGHLLAPDGTVEYPVPASLVVVPCFAYHPDQSAACMPAHSSEMASYGEVLNYPPPYFWVVGAGQRVAALFGLQYAADGGRIASILLNLGALLLLSLYMRRRSRFWGSFLLLVLTPTAVFLNAVVNPSGWEITCGLVMAAVLSQTAWSRRSEGEPRAWLNREIAILAIASIALSTARPLGFVWAAGLTVSAIALAPSIQRRGMWRIACAVAPGIVMGALWYRAHTYGVAAPVTLPGFVQAFSATFMNYGAYIHQMFGGLGWVDTWMPGVLMLLNFAAWAVLLTRLPSIRIAAKVTGIVGVVVVPCAISASVWAAWPGWWQGRYDMPFLIGFVMLLLLRSGTFIPRTISTVSGISLLSLGIMVWVNEIRYGFGLNGYSLPASLGTPGISHVRLGISAVLGAILVVISGYLLAKAWRSKPDVIPGDEPERLLTPTEVGVG